MQLSYFGVRKLRPRITQLASGGARVEAEVS